MKKIGKAYSPKKLREALLNGGGWEEIDDTFFNAFQVCPECEGLLSLAVLSSYMISTCTECGKHFIWNPKKK